MPGQWTCPVAIRLDHRFAGATCSVHVDSSMQTSGRNRRTTDVISVNSIKRTVFTVEASNRRPEIHSMQQSVQYQMRTV